MIQYYQDRERYFDFPCWVIALVKTDWKNRDEPAAIHQQLLRHNLINHKIGQLAQDMKKNHKAILRLQCEKQAFLHVHKCVWWIGGEHERYVNKIYDNLLLNWDEGDWLSPDELEAELHLNDEDNIENGLATDYQEYQFIWDTLQYLNKDQLSKLLKFADTGIESKWEKISITSGRKSRVCEIKQIDIETGEIVNSFSTRNELMQKIGIKKSHLSQCIKTAKENPKDRSLWKKWVSEGKKYGFIEKAVN